MVTGLEDERDMVVEEFVLDVVLYQTWIVMSE